MFWRIEVLVSLWGIVKSFPAKGTEWEIRVQALVVVLRILICNHLPISDCEHLNDLVYR